MHLLQQIYQLQQPRQSPIQPTPAAPKMQHHVSADDVPLLWTQPPRFLEIMRGRSGFQHPHYFFDQTDKLTFLLNRLVEDTTAFGPCEDYIQAHEVLTQLLNESQCFSSLTREQLRHLEPNVRAFVEKVQNVDVFVVEWDARRRMMNAKSASKKRGREEEEDEVEMEMAGTWKRKRDSCGAQLMDVEAVFNPTFMMQPPATQPVQWSESFFV